MIRLFVGMAAGYVLGARAGRQRFEQIKRLSSKVASNPAVQSAAAGLKTRATQLMSRR